MFNIFAGTNLFKVDLNFNDMSKNFAFYFKNKEIYSSCW